MTTKINNQNNVEWKQGDLIYKLGDDANFAYFLEKGEVEIISEKGVTVGFINEKEVFGEQSVLLGTKRTVTTKATKNSKAFRIPKETLTKEFNSSSKLIRAILRTTYIRLMNVDNTIKNNLDSILK